MREAVRGDGVRVDDGRAAAGDHGPDAALGVEHGELEGRAGGAVELLDVCFLFGEGAAEGRGPDHGRAAVGGDGALGGGGGLCLVDGEVAGDRPFRAAQRVGGLGRW